MSKHISAVGAKLRVLRKERNLNQLDLAIAAEVSVQHVGAIEKGKANPTCSTLVKMAEALNVPLEHLFDTQGYMFSEDELRELLIQRLHRSSFEDLLKRYKLDLLFFPTSDIPRE